MKKEDRGGEDCEKVSPWGQKWSEGRLGCEWKASEWIIRYECGVTERKQKIYQKTKE